MTVPVELPLVKPMLAVPAEPFNDPDFLFEVKWDGYRCLAYLEKGNTTLLSRNLKNLTPYFPDLEKLHLLVGEIPVVLDGEIIVLRDGQPSFDALQTRARLTDRDKVNRAVRVTPALYMTFDLLYRRGVSLMEMPLSQRADALRAVIEPNPLIVVSEGVNCAGKDFFQACVERGLEGVMAKRADSRYLPGTRSPLWRKIRATREVDLVICGYLGGKGGRKLGSLVLGAWSGKGFIYQGLVGTGISRAEEKMMLHKLAAISTDKVLFKETDIKGRSINWVKPVMVCKVEYLALTDQGVLRHPVYRGLRDDKEPLDCLPAV